MLITPEYVEQNRQLHAGGKYGTEGARWAPFVDSLATKCEAKSILDYGCGQGSLKRVLETRHHPFAVWEYDPAIEEKQERVARADIVVCTDVLEHIEPDCLYAVLDDIRSIAMRRVFFTVHTGAAKKTLADGRNAHLIVEPADWWLRKFMPRWKTWAFQLMNNGFIYIGVSH